MTDSAASIDRQVQLPQERRERQQVVTVGFRFCIQAAKKLLVSMFPLVAVQTGEPARARRVLQAVRT